MGVVIGPIDRVDDPQGSRIERAAVFFAENRIAECFADALHDQSLDGLIRRQAKARLIRDGVVTWEGDISTLKRFKDDVNEVKNGFECGISLVNFNDLKIADEIEAFVIEKIAATEL